MERPKSKASRLPTEQTILQNAAIAHCVLTLRLYLMYGINGLSGGFGGFGIFIPEEFWQVKKKKSP